MRLYLDLDGVLADFDLHFIETFKANHKEIGDEKMWEHIFSMPSFFRDLPPMPGAVDFFNEVAYLDPIILTACPKADYVNAATNKRNWVREHLCKDIMVLPVLGGKNKALFMHSEGDVLIDDFQSNIKSWNKHGGKGILHTDFESTRKQLWSYVHV